MSYDENSLDSLLEGFQTFKLNTPVRKATAPRSVLGELQPAAENQQQVSIITLSFIHSRYGL